MSVIDMREGWKPGFMLAGIVAALALAFSSAGARATGGGRIASACSHEVVGEHDGVAGCVREAPVATVTVYRVTRDAPSGTWINVSGCATPGGGLVWAQHPARIGVTCDSHDQIVGARWRNWGQAKARATAVNVVDNAGRVRRHAVTLVASKIRRCGTRRVYASVILHEKVAGRRRAYSLLTEGFC